MKLIYVNESYEQAKRIAHMLEYHGIMTKIGYPSTDLNASLLSITPTTPPLPVIGAPDNAINSELKEKIGTKVPFGLWVLDDHQQNAAKKLIERKENGSHEIPDEFIDSHIEIPITKKFTFRIGFFSAITCVTIFSLLIFTLSSYFSQNQIPIAYLKCAFLCGILLESVFMLKPIIKLGPALSMTGQCISIALFTALLHKFMGYKFDSYFIFLLIYIFFYVGVNSKTILPVINEMTFIIYNLVFIFFYFHFLFPEPGDWSASSSLKQLIYLVPASLSFFVLFNSLTNNTKASKLKTELYVWYLAVNSIILLLIIAPQASGIILQAAFTKEDMLIAISLGMLSMCCAIDIINILLLIPYTDSSKKEALQQRMKEISDHKEMLNSKYSDDRLSPTQNFFIILITSLILGVNHFYIHLDDLLLLAFILVFTRNYNGFTDRHQISR